MTELTSDWGIGKLFEGRSSLDELQWLEATYDERALAWARDATRTSTAALQASPHFRPLLDELTHINRNVGQVADIGIVGQRVIRLHKTAEHPKGLLQTAAWDGKAIGSWQTLLDVGAWRRDEGKTFELHWSMASVCPGGDRCLLNLHEAGGDEAELHEFDLSTGRFVEGGFSLPKSRIVSAWLDDDTLLVGHTADGAPKAPGGWPAEALVWRRGTPVGSAKSVLRMAAHHSLFFPITAGGSGQGVIAELIDYSTVAMHRVTVDGDVRRLALPTTLKLVFGANADHAFVQLSAPATLSGQALAADSVIAVPLRNSELPVELVYAARDGEVVDTFISFHVTSQSIALPVRSGLELRVDVARRDRGLWRLQSLVAPQTGVSPTIVGAGQGFEGFVIARHGFLMPPVQELVRPDGERVLLESQPPAFDASKLHVETRRTISRDGQPIDYFVVGPRERTGAVPTLMTGYGTSGVSLAPAYMTTAAGASYGGTSLRAWLERGGALVVPALRGGGEHGSAWHRAAIREKRQRSYDDFHAVAESLVASRYTRSSQLGVFGSSAGGLLAAVVGTQRPDLYGAVVSDVPATDMLRYLEMGIGPNLMDEFGDPRDPAAAAWLVKYSPYHNIHPGVKYPAFLVTVATTDNRVGPGHARKFAKRLMDAGIPALFLEPEDGGHGVSDTLQRPDVMAMRTAFFIDHLMAPATR